MAAKNLTQEFQDMIFSDNYAITMELPNISDCINSSELYHLWKYTSKTCNLVTGLLINKKGQAIPSAVVQLFATYSGKNPGDIRDDLLNWLSEHEEEVCNLAKTTSYEKSRTSHHGTSKLLIQTMRWTNLVCFS